MGWWRKNDPRSEFGGGGVQENTVYPQDSEAIDAGDRLRLQSLTGQETDSRAPIDPYHWYGNAAPEPIEEAVMTEQEILDEADPYDR